MELDQHTNGEKYPESNCFLKKDVVHCGYFRNSEWYTEKYQGKSYINFPEKA